MVGVGVGVVFEEKVEDITEDKDDDDGFAEEEEVVCCSGCAAANAFC